MSEPIAWFYEDDEIKGVSLYKEDLYEDAIPLYTHPQRELTDKEIYECHDKTNTNNWVIDFARTILKKANEK
jgi:hypothetical protein